MKNASDLRNLLMRIDHRGYPAYKDTKDKYQFDQYVLSIDHVQGDPFASPRRSAFLSPGGSPVSERNAMRQRSAASPFRIFCCAACTSK